MCESTYLLPPPAGLFEAETLNLTLGGAAGRDSLGFQVYIYDNFSLPSRVHLNILLLISPECLGCRPETINYGISNSSNGDFGRKYPLMHP